MGEELHDATLSAAFNASRKRVGDNSGSLKKTGSGINCIYPENALQQAFCPTKICLLAPQLQQSVGIKLWGNNFRKLWSYVHRSRHLHTKGAS
jgi:hypothetical protein